LCAIVAATLLAPAPIAGQTTLLTALEGSAPAPVLDPLTNSVTRGLAALWTDPTTDPQAAGLFFGMSRGSYSSVDMFHAVTAFRLGARWSVAYGSTDLGNLFDSSLTNEDPTLASLRAQSVWGRLDATLGHRWLAGSVGLGWAGDDNVGVFQSSTIARGHLRITPSKSRSVTVGLQASRAIGGSVPSQGGGRLAVDVTVNESLGPAALTFTLGASRGALWQLSETLAGYGAGAQGVLFGQLEVGAAVGRYGTTYGASRAEWFRAVSAAVRVDRVRFGTRYRSTRLGTGSGFALSLEYEAGGLVQR